MFQFERIRHIIAAIALAGAVILTTGGALVSAHAEPETAVPPINGVVETAPAQVEIIFGEEVAEGSEISVISESGRVVSFGSALIDLNDPERKRVTVALYSDLPAGTYNVVWKTVSAEDGDSADGVFTFTVTVGVAASASPVASPIGSPVAALAIPPAKQAVKDIANAAQAAATAQAATEDNFDGRAYSIALGAGLAAALFLFGFWRLVRPKPGQRVA